MKTLVEAVLAIVLFAIIPVLIRTVSANAITIGIVRLIISSGLMYLLVATTTGFPRLRPKQWGGLMLMGVIFGLHWLTYFLGIKSATAAIGSLGVASYGIHRVILGWIVERNKPSLFDFVALALVCGGTRFLSPNFELSDRTTQGLLLSILAGFFFAFLPIVHKRFPDIPQQVRAFGQYLFAAAIFLPLLPQANWDLSSKDWIGLILLSFPCTVVGHTCWIAVSTKLAPIETAVIYYLAPPLAATLAVIFLDEKITPSFIAGGTLVIAGNIIGLTRMSLKNSQKDTEENSEHPME